MNPFVFLREMARAAVVNGVTDALRDVTPADAAPPADLTALMARVESARALPAASGVAAPPPAPPRKGRKESNAADGATPDAAPAVTAAESPSMVP